jgi:uncharacterized protein (DUF433 family)
MSAVPVHLERAGGFRSPFQRSSRFIDEVRYNLSVPMYMVESMTSTSDIFGLGVYSFPEAAKLTGLPRGRVREWFRGRTSRNSQPVFTADHPPVNNSHAISFRDLIDVFVAGQLREYGVPLRTVRNVYSNLAADLGTQHPFCRNELLVYGRDVFVRGLDRNGEEEIYDALTRQKAFPKLIEPFLKSIDYDKATALAARWRIAPGVFLDPNLCFGQPVVERAVIPTYLLAEAYAANDRNADRVAGWYGITAEEVEAAVRFEAGLSA